MNKPVIIYSDLIFVLGEPNLTNKNLKCVVCWFHLSFGKSTWKPCFPGGQNVHEIHHLCELSLQGALAGFVLVDSKVLILMVLNFPGSSLEKMWIFFDKRICNDGN